MKLIYKTTTAYTHKIKFREELNDRDCTDMHYHPKVPIIVIVEATNEFLDFKDLKECVEIPLKPLSSDSDLNAMLSTDDATAEYFAQWLQKEVTYRLYQNGFGNRSVRIILHETDKYGVDTE